MTTTAPDTSRDARITELENALRDAQWLLRRGDLQAALAAAERVSPPLLLRTRPDS